MDDGIDYKERYFRLLGEHESALDLLEQYRADALQQHNNWQAERTNWLDSYEANSQQWLEALRASRRSSVSQSAATNITQALLILLAYVAGLHSAILTLGFQDLRVFLNLRNSWAWWILVAMLCVIIGISSWELAILRRDTNKPPADNASSES